MTQDIDTWFNSLDRLESVGLGAVVFYVLIVLLTRALGKRATAQMNNFDWVVTVAVGSLAASGILLKEVSIADAALAIIILGALQWLSTWLAAKSEFFAGLLKPRPRMLLHEGSLIQEALKKERVSRSEVFTALRQSGYADPAEANWVILENDGSLTVIPRKDVRLEDAELMKDVRS